MNKPDVLAIIDSKSKPAQIVSEVLLGAVVGKGAAEHGFLGLVNLVEVQADCEQSQAVVRVTGQHDQKPLDQRAVSCFRSLVYHVAFVPWNLRNVDSVWTADDLPNLTAESDSTYLSRGWAVLLEKGNSF